MIAKTQIEQKWFEFFKDFKLQLIRNFHNTLRLLQKETLVSTITTDDLRSLL